MLNDRVAILLQFTDFIRRRERSDGVADVGSKANSVIENLDIMFADQISHGRFIWSADRDPISWHRKSPCPGSIPEVAPRLQAMQGLADRRQRTCTDGHQVRHQTRSFLSEGHFRRTGRSIKFNFGTLLAWPRPRATVCQLSVCNDPAYKDAPGQVVEAFAISPTAIRDIH